MAQLRNKRYQPEPHQNQVTPPTPSARSDPPVFGSGTAQRFCQQCCGSIIATHVSHRPARISTSSQNRSCKSNLVKITLFCHFQAECDQNWQQRRKVSLRLNIQALPFQLNLLSIFIPSSLPFYLNLQPVCCSLSSMSESITRVWNNIDSFLNKQLVLRLTEF